MTEDIKTASKTMQEGGIILYPTDTIWGIGCDATNANAVQRIFDLKQRADSKAMLLLIDNPAKLNTYVDEVPDIAWELIEAADKPLTIIYDRARNLATNLPAEDGSIGIRVTREAFSMNLCSYFRKPIVSTSANISGKVAPAIFDEIDDIIKTGVDYIVKYRQDDRNKTQPSSIIKLGAGGVVQILRK